MCIHTQKSSQSVFGVFTWSFYTSVNLLCCYLVFSSQNADATVFCGVMVCSFHLQYFQCASCRKRARGAKAFLTFEADSKGGVHGGAASPLPTSSGVWESAKRFSCILKSPGSLICYVIKVKSITCGSKRSYIVINPPGGPEITWAGRLSTVTRGFNPLRPFINSHTAWSLFPLVEIYGSLLHCWMKRYYDDGQT